MTSAGELAAAVAESEEQVSMAMGMLGEIEQAPAPTYDVYSPKHTARLIVDAMPKVVEDYGKAEESVTKAHTVMAEQVEGSVHEEAVMEVLGALVISTEEVGGDVGGMNAAADAALEAIVHLDTANRELIEATGVARQQRDACSANGKRLSDELRHWQIRIRSGTEARMIQKRDSSGGNS